jgi:hypothetical protein
MLAADRPPARIAKIDERLRSRFEGGLVLELESGAGHGDLTTVEVPQSEAKPGLWDIHIVGGALPALSSLDAIEIGAATSVPSKTGALKKGAAAGGTTRAAAGGRTTGRSRKAAADRKPAEAPREAPRKGGKWFPSAENVVLVWPRIEDLLLEELE